MCINCDKDELVSKLESMKEAFIDPDQNWTIAPERMAETLQSAKALIDECIVLNNKLETERKAQKEYENSL